MKLHVYNSGDLMNELELTAGNSYTIGRKDSCDIVLEKLPGISREHFRIEDHGGTWQITVLSELRPLQYQGSEQREFNLEGSGEFYLNPYTFKFESDQDQFQQSPSEISNDLADMGPSATDEDKEPEDENFDGDEENTAIQSFNGLPYIKIIGRDGKKSEYFRLEGNLWVIGGSEGASVYLREPSAAPNHFEISKTDKGFFVVDLGSATGTDLNGQKLTPKKPSRLMSGDILTVGSTSLQFELRDKSFQRKVGNIPLNMYKNPLVFFDQNVAMVNLDDEEMESGAAEEIFEKKSGKKSNPLRTLLIFAAVGAMAVAFVNQFVSENDANKDQIASADPFGQLSPADKKKVIQTYKLAHQLYLNKNYELALVQLDNLHRIIPVYKKSKEWEEYCINARDVQKQKALIAQQRKEQEELARKVNSFISQCEGQYAKSYDIDGVKACLVHASDLDPNNPRISQLISEVTARSEERKIREKIAEEQADKIRRGKELYEKARALHKKQKWLEAIEAYENHIHSGLPDPKKLVRVSKRKLASIEKQIKTKKNSFLGMARSQYNSNNIRDAIIMARKAQKVDPYDPSISAFLFQIEKELKNKMKAIYMDSVIEERFGNLEASRVKWEEIIKQDINDGEYYLKAKRKMKQYGFEY